MRIGNSGCTSKGYVKIDIWHHICISIIIALVVILLVGSVWSAFREMYIRDVTKEMSVALSQMANGWQKVTDNAQNLTTKISDLTQLSREQRQELLLLVKEMFRDQKELQLDIERRLTHAVEQRHMDQSARTNVNFNAGAKGTQIGDGNRQE